MLETALKATEYAQEMGAELLEARMLPMLHSAQYGGPMPTSEALAYHDRMNTRDVRSPVLQRFLVGGKGMMLGLSGDFDESRRIIEQQVAQLEELGQMLSAASYGGFALGGTEASAGDWDAAVKTMRRAADQLEAAGEKAALSTVAGFLAVALYEVGDLDEAYRYSELSDEIASPDDLASQLLWRAGRAEIVAARGDADEALRLANEAVEIAEGTEALMWQCDAYMARGEVYRLLGRNEEAAADFGAALRLYEKKEAPGFVARARRKLGEVTG
jgi:tetratricopeptide (TPR) repeat protein